MKQSIERIIFEGGNECSVRILDMSRFWRCHEESRNLFNQRGVSEKPNE
jgi:hypothetical protein